MLSWIIPQVEIHAVHDIAEAETKFWVSEAEGAPGAHSSKGAFGTELEPGPRFAVAQREGGFGLQDLIKPAVAWWAGGLAQGGQRFGFDAQPMATGRQFAVDNGDGPGVSRSVRRRKLDPTHLWIVVAMGHANHLGVGEGPGRERSGIQEVLDKGAGEFPDVEHHFGAKPLAKNWCDPVIGDLVRKSDVELDMQRC